MIVQITKDLDAIPKGVCKFESDEMARRCIADGSGFALTEQEVKARLSTCLQISPHIVPAPPTGKRGPTAHPEELENVQWLVAMLHHPVIAQAVRDVVAGVRPIKPSDITAR